MDCGSHTFIHLPFLTSNPSFSRYPWCPATMCKWLLSCFFLMPLLKTDLCWCPIAWLSPSVACCNEYLMQNQGNTVLVNKKEVAYIITAVWHAFMLVCLLSWLSQYCLNIWKNTPHLNTSHHSTSFSPLDGSMLANWLPRNALMRHLPLKYCGFCVFFFCSQIWIVINIRFVQSPLLFS